MKNYARLLTTNKNNSIFFGHSPSVNFFGYKIFGVINGIVYGVDVNRVPDLFTFLPEWNEKFEEKRGKKLEKKP